MPTFVSILKPVIALYMSPVSYNLKLKILLNVQEPFCKGILGYFWHQIELEFPINSALGVTLNDILGQFWPCIVASFLVLHPTWWSNKIWYLSVTWPKLVEAPYKFWNLHVGFQRISKSLSLRHLWDQNSVYYIRLLNLWLNWTFSWSTTYFRICLFSNILV